MAFKIRFASVQRASSHDASSATARASWGEEPSQCKALGNMFAGVFAGPVTHPFSKERQRIGRGTTEGRVTMPSTAPVSTFRAKLWLYPAPVGWHFLSLPPDLSARFRFEAEGPVKPGASVKVEARIGGFAWTTSLFWDSASKAYCLPVKADVRKRTGVKVGDDVETSVRTL